MMTALQIGAGFVLTAILLTVAVALSAFQLGRLVTRDDDQRQVEAPPRRTSRTTMMAALALFAASGGSSLVHARVPRDCRAQCSLDLEFCRNACIDSRDFDGCLAECNSVEEDCLVGCPSAAERGAGIVREEVE